MAILKCKICGGDLELNDDRTVGMCQYCGCTMTFPKIDDEQRAAVFNRGNHFRRIGEFDKALAVYERIVREDETDAEAHWCSALCRFGIEYVEDPATFEWLPTCHRASFDSFLEDVDYLAAVEHSEGLTRRQYQKDAAKIAEVQRGILATSQNAEPYDVFICYKESDENGQRTVDSTLAQDIYYQLTEQGRKVFFARITLEDVVGTQYEPFIFAALNSAKVMIVVGTKPEYLNAVWVKNEWSRFLAMMKKDRHKLLLPCYRDMDPYDLPEQLSVLQSYDMAKIGFIQDLIRGVSKVLDAEKKPEVVKETVATNPGAANIFALLDRATLALEDGEFNRADEFCEQALNIDARNGLAYLLKLMVELNVRTREELKNQEIPFENSPNYQKAIRFGNQDLNDELNGYIEQIKHRHLETMYQDAIAAMTAANNEGAYKKVSAVFMQIMDYKDAAELAQQCLRKAELCKTEELYQYACRIMEKAKYKADFINAAQRFEELKDYKDAANLAVRCRTVKAIESEEAEKRENFYQETCDMMDNSYTVEDYDKLIERFAKLGDYKDSKSLLNECKQTREIAINQEAGEEQKGLGQGLFLFLVTLFLVLGVWLFMLFVYYQEHFA